MKVLANPKARIAVLAVLALGGAYFLLRRSSSSSVTDPTATAPVTPGDQLGAVPLGGMGDGIGAADPTATIPDPTGAAPIPDQKLQDAIQNAIDMAYHETADALNSGNYSGFGDPTGGASVGDAPAPGNKVAGGGGSIPFVPLGPIHPPENGAGAPSSPTSNHGKGGIKTGGRKGIQPPPRAPRSKKRKVAKKPKLGMSQWAQTISGAHVITRPAVVTRSSSPSRSSSPLSNPFTLIPSTTRQPAPATRQGRTPIPIARGVKLVAPRNVGGGGLKVKAV